jgi:hypothetical protein
MNRVYEIAELLPEKECEEIIAIFEKLTGIIVKLNRESVLNSPHVVNTINSFTNT